MDPLPVALEAIPKALVYATVILSVGVPAARLLFLTRVAGLAVSTLSAAADSPVDRRAAFDASLTPLAILAAGGLIVGLLLRVWAHTAVAFGVAESTSLQNLVLIARDSQWGQAWTLQMAGAATLAVFAWATSQVPQAAWPMTSLLAAGMCYLLPLLGHAEGEPVRLLVHGSHMLGAGIWLGTLMTIAVTGDVVTRPLLLRAFAPFAIAGSALLVAAGLVATWMYLGSPKNIVDTPYGWALALKLIFVADVGIFGFLNWRRHHGRSAQAAATAAREAAASREPFVRLELLMAIAVIVATAILTEIEHP